MKLNNIYIVTIDVYYIYNNTETKVTIKDMMFYKTGRCLIDIDYFKNKSDLLKIKLENIFIGDNYLITKKFSGNYSAKYLHQISLVNNPIRLFDTNDKISFEKLLKLREKYKNIELFNEQNIIKQLRKEYKNNTLFKDI